MSVVDDLYDLDPFANPRLRLTLDDGREFRVFVNEAVVREERTRHGDGHLDYSIEFYGDVVDAGLPSETGFVYYRQHRRDDDDGPLLVVWDADEHGDRAENAVGAVASVERITEEGDDA